jgi:hypothetical protein
MVFLSNLKKIFVRKINEEPEYIRELQSHRAQEFNKTMHICGINVGYRYFMDTGSSCTKCALYTCLEFDVYPYKSVPSLTYKYITISYRIRTNCEYIEIEKVRRCKNPDYLKGLWIRRKILHVDLLDHTCKESVKRVNRIYMN